MADIRSLHARSVEDFAALAGGVPPDAWSNPTPCTDWDVRTLVNHVVGEDLWTVPLVEGATVAEVGDRFDGDLLGADPIGAAEGAAKAAIAAFAADDAMRRTVHLSFGDFPGADYAWQLFADHLVHGWDLAVATGQPPRLDPEAVDALAGWWTEVEGMYRQGGVVGERVEVGPDASGADRLLAAFGRDSSWQPA